MSTLEERIAETLRNPPHSTTSGVGEYQIYVMKLEKLLRDAMPMAEEPPSIDDLLRDMRWMIDNIEKCGYSAVEAIGSMMLLNTLRAAYDCIEQRK